MHISLEEIEEIFGLFVCTVPLASHSSQETDVFHFNIFLKRFDMLGQCLVQSVNKKLISFLLVL